MSVIVPEGSNSILAILAETTLGVTPASPHFTKSRHASALFNPNLETVENDDITGSGQSAGTKLVALNGSGNQDYNMVIGGHPLQEKSALRAVDKTTGTITCTTTCAFTATTNLIELSGAQLNGFVDVIPGMVIYISGASPVGNNGFMTVLEKTSDSIIKVLESLTTAAAGPAVIKWAKQVTGSTLSSFCAEHSYQSPSLIRLINGIVTKAWSFSGGPRSKVTGKFDFLTLAQSHPDASVETSAYDSAPAAARDILNSTQNMARMQLSVYSPDGTHGTPMVNTFSNLSFSVDNGAEYIDAIGEGLYPVGITQHDVVVKAELQAYYRNKAAFEAAIAQNKLTLRFALTDGSVTEGSWKFFCLPMCDIMDLKFNATKKKEDGMVTISLQAKQDSYVTGQSLIISEHIAA